MAQVQQFNNLGLDVGMDLKTYTSVANRLKIKVRKFWEITPIFVEVTGEKLIRGGRLLTPPPIHPINSVKGPIIFSYFQLHRN